MTHPAIEKLARAIRMEFHGRWGDEHPWEEMTDIEKSKWLRIIEIAHRLILSEPPSVDVVIVGRQLLEGWTDDDDDAGWDIWAKRTFEAMNRARLRELGLDE